MVTANFTQVTHVGQNPSVSKISTFVKPRLKLLLNWTTEARMMNEMPTLTCSTFTHAYAHFMVVHKKRIR
jgi:hypothetical protein